MNSTREDFLNFKGYKTWFAVHGGPRFPHNSLNNTGKLAQNGYPVVLYDQLGCGPSDRPGNISLWEVETFVEELNELRKYLGFDRINLLGQPWGGSLVTEYSLNNVLLIN